MPRHAAVARLHERDGRAPGLFLRYEPAPRDSPGPDLLAAVVMASSAVARWPLAAGAQLARGRWILYRRRRPPSVASPIRRENTIDLRVGAYVQGGIAVDVSARTEGSTTRVRYDHLDPQGPMTGAVVPDPADGLLVEARGARRGPSVPCARAGRVGLRPASRGPRRLRDDGPRRSVAPVRRGRARDIGGCLVVHLRDGRAVGCGARGGDFLAVDAAGPYVTLAHATRPSEASGPMTPPRMERASRDGRLGGARPR